MGVSQILIMYITNLIIMAFIIILMKHQNMLKSTMEVCKYKWELEIVTKPMRATLQISKTMVVLSTKLPLKVMHPNSPLLKFGTHPLQGTITLTSCESPHLHQIQ